MAVYSVSQVVVYLKELLDYDAVVRDVWIRGEVANLNLSAPGHSYYTLREAQTTLRCVAFRQAAGARWLANGASVVVHGRLSFYEARGDLQLIVDVVRPEGVGELQIELDRLRLKLETEGLFEQSRKRPLPRFPARLGVVTSPSGAVWQDIQTVVGRRYPMAELLLAPTAVQGEGAVSGIVAALEALDRIPDVDSVIVARGGGSLEDLRPFNTEEVARAIFASRAPVISGVGHETDTTIADMVADRRAPTPSAAAELAVPDRLELAAGLAASRQALTTAAAGQLRRGRDAVARLQPRLAGGLPDVDGLRLQVDDLLYGAARHLRRDVSARSERAESLSMRLEALSPRETLRRGYAAVHRGVDGPQVVSDSNELEPGDLVRVTLARGGFGAEVLTTHDGSGVPAKVSGA
jgi:exodeoxyribonuclease VII large subunit